ncbi:hypothetical protein QAD02_018353 [Eretmocerus hayati]|uniref:Uncharacterized protein n=1 Tax=Eretmocerus hayati TaxID=131215 RepID=A0ACC2PHQ5_9HYME|nr:hypothetical protein QAD02_018353 [Eretmocerus hayati]
MAHERLIASILEIMLISLQCMEKAVQQFGSLRIRRWWVRPHIQEELRQQYGALTTIFIYFHLRDNEDIYNHFGTTVEHFDILLRYLRVTLTRYSPRGSLEPELKLAAVLSFLVHNVTLRCVELFCRIGHSTNMYKIIPEVCRTIVGVLRDQYVVLPSTPEEWLAVTQAFYDRYQIVHCFGALDSKHLRIKTPPHSGALFFNRKRFYSIHPMAVVDSVRRFLWVSAGDFGTYERNSTLFN